MSTRKTVIDREQVLDFLTKSFDSSIAHVTQLEGGEMSCPFSFTARDVDYVIRIDPKFSAYEKDAYAWKYFASEKLPIPEMVRLGKFDEKYYFAITKKAKGNIMDHLTKDEMLKTIPETIATLEEIHSIDISQTSGYGYWDKEGKAPHKTWKDYLLSLHEHIAIWKENNTREYFDPSLLDKVFEAYNALIAYTPEERYLLHGDFGYSNVVVDKEKITAVLDWGESRYGDFVYDIAWLDVWQDDISYEALFKKYYESIHKSVLHFSKRILCYKLHILYGSLQFVIESDQLDQYKEIENILHNLLYSI